MTETPPTVIINAETAPPAAAAPAAAAPQPPPPPPPAATTAMGRDTRGRVITIKKLGPLDRMRLFKALGSDGCKNELVLGYATLAAAVVSIDGSVEVFPQTERQIEAMVARLDDDGLEAVGRTYKLHFGTGEDDELKPDTIKN